MKTQIVTLLATLSLALSSVERVRAQAAPADVAPPRPSPPVQTADSQFAAAYRLLQKADKARDTGHLANALRSYREALFAYARLSKAYPDLQQSVVKFRMLYCDNQMDTLLKEMKKKGISASPGDASSKPGRHVGELKTEAKRRLKENKPSEARALLLEGIRADPDDGTLRLLIAISHCQTHEFDHAMYLLKSLIRDEPAHADAHVVLAAALFATGHANDARDELRAALTLDPNHRDALFDMAQVLLEIKPPDPAAARTHYEKALSLGAEPDEALAARLRP